jgi:class 3 adenylate cyclase
MQHHRQLAAILFTDIVGYTSLMQRDDPGKPG